MADCWEKSFVFFDKNVDIDWHVIELADGSSKSGVAEARADSRVKNIQRLSQICYFEKMLCQSPPIDKLFLQYI